MMSKRAWPDGPWITNDTHKCKVRVGFEVAFPSVKPGVRNWEEREAHAEAAKKLIELAPEMAEAILEMIKAGHSIQSGMLEAVKRLVAVANQIESIENPKKLVPTLEVPHG